MGEDKYWKKDDFQRANRQVNYINDKEHEKSTSGFGPNAKEIFGLCSTCSYFELVVNDVHQIIRAKCVEFEVHLGKNRVSNCSSFNKVGQLNLNTMWQIATKIDITPDKDKPGFLTKGKKDENISRSD